MMQAATQSRRRSVPRGAVLIGLLFAAAGTTAAEPSPRPAERDLSRLLARLDLVAQVYRDRALRFTCDESIAFYPPRGGVRKHKFHYVYTRDEAGRLQDYRFPRRRRNSRSDRST
jgi:hypothetical protein